jgi:AcrR family transcriptional regulator
MGKVRATALLLRTRPLVRTGRPPRKLAGEVDARILQAARQVFLECGLAGASIDEIASLARAGKPTIYARFSGKEALFTEVVMRDVAHTVEGFAGEIPAGATIDERLTKLGATILRWVLVADTVDLMRVAISEARRFPNLASNVHRMARGRCEDTVRRLLAEVAKSDTLGVLPAFAPERIAATTRFFTDLVLAPMVMRALFGEKLKSLQAEVGPHVARSVSFFLASCRHGDVS